MRRTLTQASLKSNSVLTIEASPEHRCSTPSRPKTVSDLERSNTTLSNSSAGSRNSAGVSFRASRLPQPGHASLTPNSKRKNSRDSS